MIGSETFIIVAFRWIENSMPAAFVASICSAKKLSSARADMKVASTTVPAVYETPSFKTVTLPSLATSSMRAAPACSAVSVTDFSLEKKSFADMVETVVLLSGAHTPIECGLDIA